MEISKENTVASYVTQNIKTAHVFKKHGIDFCCGGAVSLAKACAKAGVDLGTLKKDLLATEEKIPRNLNFNSWELDFLSDHIVHFHHSYVEESIPLIYQYAAKVAKVHGGHNPELIEIQQLFSQVANELSAHLKKEELVLFPFIKELVEADRGNIPVPNAAFGSVDNPIKMMEAEHEEAGEIMKKISALSGRYTPPEHACNTYRAFYAKLDEFEQDLHQHIHLENNILFPKALKLEQTLHQ